MSLQLILQQQEQWAIARWANHKGRRAPSLEANLFVEMSDRIRTQFTLGSGSELGRKGKPGKMWSIRSSSALSYSFFAPWDSGDPRVFSRALSTEIVDRSILFEQKFRHGLRGIPPNIDVVFDASSSRPLGLECKFSEPYGTRAKHLPLDEKYFPEKRMRWRELGLPRCQELAEAIGREVTFSRLDAGQLLKHLLGLTRISKASPRLRYVWYDAQSAEAREHATELQLFQSLVDQSVDFKAVSYQQVFTLLEKEPDPMQGWRTYMRERYFANVPNPGHAGG